jgi:hypothetical protein
MNAAPADWPLVGEGSFDFFMVYTVSVFGTSTQQLISAKRNWPLLFRGAEA